MDVRDSSIRVLMLPWLAHGHISPFLELAKKLSERNFNTYVCSTQVNLDSVKNRITDKYTQSIELIELELPCGPELPPKYHTTNGLPPHLHGALGKAYEMAGPTIANIIRTIRPDVVIYDQNQPLTSAAASALNIPSVQFVISGAAMFSFMIHLFKCRGGEKYPFPEIHIKKFDELTPRSWGGTNHGNDGNSGDRVLGSVLRSTDIVLISSFREMEGKYLDYLSEVLGKKMVPVGPLIRDPIEKDDHSEIITWLDKKDELSTVFVSFGSECYLTKEEILELAYGLELSNINFIWVLRISEGENATLEDLLPEGFGERVGERGIVMDAWAPQPKILGHPNTGGFLCHCGWNSVMESMMFGVPIIAMPMHLEQPLNARLIVEVGLGVEVDKDSNGIFPRNEIAKKIRKVVVDKDGDKIKAKANEWSELLRVKAEAEEEIQGVVDEILQLCRERKK